MQTLNKRVVHEVACLQLLEYSVRITTVSSDAAEAVQVDKAAL